MFSFPSLARTSTTIDCVCFLIFSSRDQHPLCPLRCHAQERHRNCTTNRRDVANHPFVASLLVSTRNSSCFPFEHRTLYKELHEPNPRWQVENQEVSATSNSMMEWMLCAGVTDIREDDLSMLFWLPIIHRLDWQCECFVFSCN
jgi:hypothetical protein